VRIRELRESFMAYFLEWSEGRDRVSNFLIRGGGREVTSRKGRGGQNREAEERNLKKRSSRGLESRLALEGYQREVGLGRINEQKARKREGRSVLDSKLRTRPLKA